MKFTYTMADSIRHLSSRVGFELTDAEVESLVASDGARIEASRLAIQQASQKHEDLVISLAAQALAKRATPNGGAAK